MMPNQLQKMETESVKSSENLSESLQTETNTSNLLREVIKQLESDSIDKNINPMAKVSILPNSNL